MSRSALVLGGESRLLERRGGWPAVACRRRSTMRLPTDHTTSHHIWCGCVVLLRIFSYALHTWAPFIHHIYTCMRVNRPEALVYNLAAFRGARVFTTRSHARETFWCMCRMRSPRKCILRVCDQLSRRAASFLFACLRVAWVGPSAETQTSCYFWNTS